MITVSCAIEIRKALQMTPDDMLRAEMEARAADPSLQVPRGRATTIDVEGEVRTAEALSEIDDDDLRDEMSDRGLWGEADDRGEDLARGIRDAVAADDRQHLRILLNRLAPDAVL